MPVKRAMPGVDKALGRELGQAGCQEGEDCHGRIPRRETLQPGLRDVWGFLSCTREEEMEKGGDILAERRVGTKHGARNQLSEISSK